MPVIDPDGKVRYPLSSNTSSLNTKNNTAASPTPKLSPTDMQANSAMAKLSAAAPKAALQIHNEYSRYGFGGAGVKKSLENAGLSVPEGSYNASDMANTLRSDPANYTEVPLPSGLNASNKESFLKSIPPGYIVVKTPNAPSQSSQSIAYVSLGNGRESSDWVGNITQEQNFQASLQDNWNIYLFKPNDFSTTPSQNKVRNNLQ